MRRPAPARFRVSTGGTAATAPGGAAVQGNPALVENGKGKSGVGSQLRRNTRQIGRLQIDVYREVSSISIHRI
jgi:hypothetical protein